jgi:NAD(P)-dependent dehydrogenase (short-subunit alcohol dehydrogenase family)
MASILSSVDQVKGKVALVTGAASGIGRGVAELLYARGAKVVAEDIDPAVKKLERDGLRPAIMRSSSSWATLTARSGSTKSTWLEAHMNAGDHSNQNGKLKPRRGSRLRSSCDDTS